MRSLVLSLGFLLALVASASAQDADQKHIVAVCGPFKGISYYMDPGKHGWRTEDDIPLKIIFSREKEDEGNYQITYLPASGKRYDLRDEGGGSISVVDNRAVGTITFIVAYASTLQPTTYHLKVNSKGEGEMVMAQLKSNQTTQNTTMRIAKCGTP